MWPVMSAVAVFLAQAVPPATDSKPPPKTMSRVARSIFSLCWEGSNPCASTRSSHLPDAFPPQSKGCAAFRSCRAVHRRPIDPVSLFPVRHRTAAPPPPAGPRAILRTPPAAANCRRSRSAAGGESGDGTQWNGLHRLTRIATGMTNSGHHSPAPAGGSPRPLRRQQQRSFRPPAGRGDRDHTISSLVQEREPQCARRAEKHPAMAATTGAEGAAVADVVHQCRVTGFEQVAADEPERLARPCVSRIWPG